MNKAPAVVEDTKSVDTHEGFEAFIKRKAQNMDIRFYISDCLMLPNNSCHIFLAWKIFPSHVWNSMRNLCSACPVLKELVIRECWGITRLCVDSLRLLSLTTDQSMCWKYGIKASDQEIILNIPHLEDLASRCTNEVCNLSPKLSFFTNIDLYLDYDMHTSATVLELLEKISGVKRLLLGECFTRSLAIDIALNYQALDLFAC